jgi:hypothetical protein
MQAATKITWFRVAMFDLFMRYRVDSPAWVSQLCIDRQSPTA